MDASVFLAVALACAPQVHADTARALVSVESAFNPWAIGVVGGALVRQPRHRAEALATARALRDAGWSFSVGLGQINVGNFERLGLTVESAFEPCANLAAMQSVLAECFDRENHACIYTPSCALKGVLRSATDAYLDVLDGVTLADLIRKEGRRASKNKSVSPIRLYSKPKAKRG